MMHLVTLLTLLLVGQVASAQVGDLSTMIAQQRQVVDLLTAQHVEHAKIYDARNFGLPAPDSLRLRTKDGLNLFAYETCPEAPRGVVICLSGIHNPSVTAYYGHAAEFYKAHVATIMPDLRAHGKSEGTRIGLAYTEVADVQAVVDYIKRQPRYEGVPIIVMGVSMGAAVALRSAAAISDISGVISLSSFSSVEDFMAAQCEALLPTIPADKVDEVTRATMNAIYGVDASTSSPLYALRQMAGRPVLLMHSRGDSQIPFACYERLLAEMSHYTHDIDTLVVAGDEHFICPDFTRPADNPEYLRRLMRFVRKLTVAHPYVRTDEFVELMEVVARFANNSVFNDTVAPRYQADIDRHFAPMKNHPAVAWMKGQLSRYGISFDAVPWMGVHLRWKDGHFTTYANCNKHYKRWPASAVKAFLPLLSDFYVKSRFHDFYLAHTDTYQTAVEAARINMADYLDVDWFEAFFRPRQSARFGIIVGLNNGFGSFSVERQLPGSPREKISVMLYAEDANGHPVYYRDSEEDKILVHEFCHPYIKAPRRYKRVGQRLLEQHRAKLNSVGYGTWQNVIEETLVRASVVRYMIDHGYSTEAIRAEIENQHNFYGFVWLPTDIEWYKGDVLSLFDHMS